MKAKLTATIFLVLVFFGTQSSLIGQCAQSTVTVNITTDNYPHETSWSVLDANGNLLGSQSLTGQPNFTLVTFDVCVDSNACLTFIIEDQFSDGINAPGGFEVLLDSVLALTNVPFFSSYSSSFNCLAGSTCGSSEVITEGNYQTSYDDHWYSFTPDSSGIYDITTCGLTTCDTKIWGYSSCPSGAINDDNTGTVFFDDNFGGCGEQANISISMEAGVQYIIRVGDDQNACGDTISWLLSFSNYISGCTDPNSCNYNPLATIDDGSCLAHGDPACPEAPDLVLDQEVLRTSLYLDQIDNTDNCLIDEGCLQGYGVRDIVRFATRIDNIGELDYYIGKTKVDSSQFTYENCHGHPHYDGYAEYLLYDQDGQKIPIGFKNGFCVLDLGCTTGTTTYGCLDMGISAGCYDEYWAALECQWVDVTDIPDGAYILVTRVNWDNAPDALGRIEKDTLNNWAQACIIVDRSSGILEVTQATECDPYTDCNGVLYGDSEFDCTGVCGGLTLMGDLNVDQTQSSMDVDAYIEGIISSSLLATTCNDLTADGVVDIYDLSLLTSCLSYGNIHDHTDTGPHDHCDFPYNIIAQDEASLEIIDFDPTSYVDIAIRNANSRIIGYQFTMSGIKVSGVENLIESTEYDQPVVMDPLTNMVMSVNRDSQYIERNNIPEAMVRVYFSEITSEEICIESIQGIINYDLQSVPNSIEGPCTLISSTSNTNALMNTIAFPNPTNNTVSVVWEAAQKVFGWDLTTTSGQIVASNTNSTYPSVEQRLDLDLSANPPGLYILKIRSEKGLSIVKLLR